MKTIKSRIIDILENHFDEPAKIDDWTANYMQEKFIAIAVDIESLFEEILKTKTEQL